MQSWFLKLVGMTLLHSLSWLCVGKYIRLWVRGVEYDVVDDESDGVESEIVASFGTCSKSLRFVSNLDEDWLDVIVVINNSRLPIDHREVQLCGSFSTTVLGCAIFGSHLSW